MTIAHEFAYHRPTSLDEALALLGGAAGAAPLAGGTDLVGWLRDELIAPPALVDLKGIAGLDLIEATDGALRLGPLVTFADLIRSAEANAQIPLLVEAARTVASTAIRNRATVVGNICSAVPCCDAGPPLLAYEAVVHVRGKAGERSIPIDAWFVGPRRTALASGEVVTGLEIPLPDGKHGGCYAKLGRYDGEDLAQASVAVLALPERRYRVAFGAVAPTPVRGRRIEAALEGRGPDDASLDAAVALLPDEIAPITDLRASETYRMRMTGVMLRRGVAAAVSRLENGTPAYGTGVI